MEKLIDRRYRRYNKDKKLIEYLIKQRGYGPEFGEQYDEDLLNDIVKLILKYEFRTNSHLERIDYLKKLTVGKDDIAYNDDKIFIFSRYNRGRPKGSNDRKNRR